MSGAPLPLIVTSGDPSGIGPELTLRAWLERQAHQRPFGLLADPAHIQRLATHLGWSVPIVPCAIEDVNDIFAHALPLVPLTQAVEGRAGLPSPDDAAMTIESIARGVGYVHAGKAHGIVTNPIAKEHLYRAGFTHPGHTEYLGALAQDLWGITCQPVMMLWSEQLAVVPITIHLALRDAINMLTPDLIISTAEIVAHDLAAYFGLAHPRLVCAGLNPHAGENGTMGREDLEIITPALTILRQRGINIKGPLSADTLFHAHARQHYDVALCMYHDQALIPIKTLAFDEGVNVTLGLPFIRTSPDHGTAFDIAGKGIARASSLVAALTLANRLTAPKRVQL
jgi:4-hydroxythreonine-4-phosphate dehydrogenase